MLSQQDIEDALKVLFQPEDEVRRRRAAMVAQALVVSKEFREASQPMAKPLRWPALRLRLERLKPPRKPEDYRKLWPRIERKLGIQR